MKKDIATVLQSEMDKRGWSDTITADKSGVPQSTIYRIVHGQVKKPHKSTVTMLAAVFGMSYRQFIGLVNDSAENNVPLVTQNNHQARTFEEVDRQIDIIYKSVCMAVEHSGVTLTAEELAQLFKNVLEHQLTPRLVHEPLDESIQVYVKNAMQVKH